MKHQLGLNERDRLQGERNAVDEWNNRRKSEMNRSNVQSGHRSNRDRRTLV